jgi:chorismate synthase
LANTLGTYFKLTTFGESHGKAIGGIIDGIPSGIKIDEDFIQNELIRRKPGQSKITTQRKESDTVQLLSGVFNGKSTGTPIGFIIWNEDAKSNDYEHIKDTFRPSHADYTYTEKYQNYDYRGGGRSSARETANWVVGGALAKLLLKKYKIKITAYVQSVGEIAIPAKAAISFNEIEKNMVRCPDKETADKMIQLIEKTKKKGDTVGGIIRCIIENVPAGWGEPVFNKLHADLGKAMLSINAAKGFEYGSGFDGTKMFGSQHNDIFEMKKGKISTKTNNSGGIQGGISNGETIYFNVAFKPVATLIQEQITIDKTGNKAVLKGKGRHDPCVLPRAVPIVEALVAMVLADASLAKK